MDRGHLQRTCCSVEKDFRGQVTLGRFEFMRHFHMGLVVQPCMCQGVFICSAIGKELCPLFMPDVGQVQVQW